MRNEGPKNEGQREKERERMRERERVGKYALLFQAEPRWGKCNYIMACMDIHSSNTAQTISEERNVIRGMKCANAVAISP